MNFLRNIQLAFSAKARNQFVNEVLASDKAEDRRQQAKETVIKQKQYAEPVQNDPVVGHISTADLLDFSSRYGRRAVAELGIWSAIAKGFTAFCKDQRDPSIETFIQEFHAWNQAADIGRYNAEDSNVTSWNDERTLETIARMSQVKPAVGNKQTDEVIARVLKKSIEEVKADRVAKAEKKSKEREDHILAFNSLLWSSVWSEGEFSMPAQKVVTKLEQTLLWMAGWDTTNPAALATELLLLEADMTMVKNISKKEVGTTNDFEDGTMCADTLTRRFA